MPLISTLIAHQKTNIANCIILQKTSSIRSFQLMIFIQVFVVFNLSLRYQCKDEIDRYVKFVV